MTLICFASQKGSPGTTATALAVAAALKVSPGRRKLLLEADSTGGTLAIRYRLPVEPGLLTLAAAVRGGIDVEGLWRHAQVLPGGLPVVLCPDGPEQVHAAMAASGAQLARFLNGLSDVDVICDVGRLAPDSPSLAFVAEASALLMVARPNAEQLQPSARRLTMLKPRVANLGWVLIGQKPYGAAEVEATYGFPVVGLIADDARSVASLEGGVISKRLRRHPFVRSSVTLAKTLSDWLAPISSVGPSIASVPSDQAVGPITPEPARASRNAVGPSMPSAQTGRTEPVGPPPPPTAESQRRAGLPNQSGSTAGPESRPAAGSAPGPEPSQPPVPPPTLPGPPPPPPPAGSQPILAEPPPITAAAPAEPGEPVDGSLRPVQSGEPVDGSSRPPAAFRSRNTSPGSSHGPAPVPAGADRPSAPNGPPRSAAAEAGAAAHEDHVEVSVNPGPAEKSPLAARQAGRGFMHGPTPHRPETERSPLEPRWAYHGNGVDDTGPGPHDELDDELDDQLNDENWYPEFTVTADLGEVFDRPGPVEPAIAEAEVLPCTPPLPPRPPTPPPTSQLVGRAPLANGSDHPSDQRSAPRSPFPHEESDPDWASW